MLLDDIKTRCKGINTQNHLELAKKIVKKINYIPQKNYAGYFRKSFRSCIEKFEELLKE